MKLFANISACIYLRDIKVAAVSKNVLTSSFPFKRRVRKIDFGKCINSFLPLGDDIVQLRIGVFNSF